jgi:radical SAM protein with 4Fe4S-binding SPASM domain
MPRARHIALQALDLHLTSRCNLGCEFCSTDANAPGARGRLPLPRLRMLLDEAVTMGLEELNLTGGEPALSPQLEALVQHATGLGVRTRIITNGTAIGRARLEALWRAGLRSITVSIDALASTHDTMRGQRGTWRSAMGTVSHAVDLGYATQVAAVAFSSNVHEIPQLMVVAAQREVGGFSIFMGSPLGRGQAWKDRVLGRRAWRAFLAELQHGVHRGDFGDDMDILAEQGWAWADDGLATATPPQGHGAGCSGLDDHYHHLLLRADGRLYQCVFFLHAGPSLGDLGRRSLGEVLHKARQERPAHHLTQLPPACARCDRAKACGGGCRGYAELYRGDPRARDPRCPGPDAQSPWPSCPIATLDLRTGAVVSSSSAAVRAP